MTPSAEEIFTTAVLIPAYTEQSSLSITDLKELITRCGVDVSLQYLHSHLAARIRALTHNQHVDALQEQDMHAVLACFFLLSVEFIQNQVTMEKTFPYSANRQPSATEI